MRNKKVSIYSIFTQINQVVTFIDGCHRAITVGALKMKYTQEVKDNAVAAFNEGKSFKEIQMTVGPNPKAVQRYLAKAGIDYKAKQAELKAEGKLKEPVNKQGKAKSAKASKAVQAEEVIEE